MPLKNSTCIITLPCRSLTVASDSCWDTRDQLYCVYTHTHTVVTCTVNAFNEALSTSAELPDHYEAFVFFLISLDCVFFIPLFFRSLIQGWRFGHATVMERSSAVPLDWLRRYHTHRHTHTAPWTSPLIRTYWIFNKAIINFCIRVMEEKMLHISISLSQLLIYWWLLLWHFNTWQMYFLHLLLKWHVLVLISQKTPWTRLKSHTEQFVLKLILMHAFTCAI